MELPLPRGHDGGKQRGRKRTFPGVGFSWKGACLELTSHGTKQQRLENRLKNVVCSRPALHVTKLQDGRVIFRNVCFYVVLLARQPVLSSEEALTPVPSYIPTHPLVQGERCKLDPPPQAALCQNQAHSGNLHTEPRTRLPSPSRRGCSSTLPARVHLHTARHEPHRPARPPGRSSLLLHAAVSKAQPLPSLGPPAVLSSQQRHQP